MGIILPFSVVYAMGGGMGKKDVHEKEQLIYNQSTKSNERRGLESLNK